MAGRYLGDGHHFVKIGDTHRYRVGDTVFYSTGNHTVAGEGMFIGYLKGDEDVLVLAKGALLATFFTIDNSECAPAGGGFPAVGRSSRRAYLKANPGALKP